MVQKSAYTDTEARADECVLASSGPYNEANIFLGLIEYELNSLLGASHLIDSSYSIRPLKILAKYIKIEWSLGNIFLK